MSYLPDVYASFRAEYPEVVAAVDGVGAAVDQAGTLDAKTMRLVKLTMAIGAGAEGAVRSNVRKTRSEGVTPEEIRPAGLAAITTTGFSAAVAGLGSIDQAFGLERESQTSWSGPLLGNADESDRGRLLRGDNRAIQPDCHRLGQSCRVGRSRQRPAPQST